MEEVLKSLAEQQRKNMLEGILSLYRYSVYSTVDSSLAVDGKVDKIIKQLEDIYREYYE